MEQLNNKFRQNEIPCIQIFGIGWSTNPIGISLAGVVESLGPNKIQSCVEGEINVGLKGNHWLT